MLTADGHGDVPVRTSPKVLAKIASASTYGALLAQQTESLSPSTACDLIAAQVETTAERAELEVHIWLHRQLEGRN